ncbi:hypothetical protein BKK79_05930 [Cupriavidus sp. USMAA2-4]|uniref:HEAT repeat domain-containing protein n=1 Tax=Cupriavidus malaysiensis TaxID=367825 RepID=A0ABM6F8X9_9BURK|nr:hypothetical protein BKK79_05930 [Cupriavidus sp. USMAA2-4]AOZ01184.1 hypothetical protein BKK81_06935 [Cupriavidus sp. USMAHM13]AOZ08012.1 hypothetical protein BKK80_06225 [Cupriavidus malaysiensis]
MLSYRMLLFKISRLTGRNRMTAVDEIALAGQLAEMMHRPHAAERVVADLMDHEHAQVRRVALNAVRRARCFACPNLLPALLRRLADAEPWLRHDAAWVVAEGQFDGAELRAALRRLAGRTQLPQDAARARAFPDDALLQAQVKARTALDALLKKSAAEANRRLGLAGAAGYAKGTVGHNNMVRRETNRRTAARRLDSSVRLTYRPLPPPEGVLRINSAAKTKTSPG